MTGKARAVAASVLLVAAIGLLLLGAAPGVAQPAPSDAEERLDECLGDGYYPEGPPTCTFDSEGNLIDRDVPGEDRGLGNSGTLIWVALLWMGIPLVIGVAVAGSRGWNAGTALLVILVFGWLGLLFLFFVNRDQAVAAGRHVTSDHPDQVPDVTESIRKLGLLRDEGLLTEDEFQAKKAELLSTL